MKFDSFLFFIDYLGRVSIMFLLLYLGKDVWGTRLEYNWYWTIAMMVLLVWINIPLIKEAKE